MVTGSAACIYSLQFLEALVHNGCNIRGRAVPPPPLGGKLGNAVFDRWNLQKQLADEQSCIVLLTSLLMHHVIAI